MAGLEKITDQILSDAKQEAARIVADAEKQAAKILAEADAKTQDAVSQIKNKAQNHANVIKSRVESANEQFERTEKLTIKQEVISSVIEKAYEKVCNLPTDQYFGLLEKFITEYAQPGDGTICFSKEDLGRMPADFEAKAQAAAQKAGGTLTISKEDKNIENGFVLIYDGIDENCTIRAIFDAQRAKMQDKVNELLYRKED
ncbi:MAG: hypothetical protein K6G01_02415 [Eubacterium sp.]|nr:hypothetical protein [Eubacterium sp.]